MKKHLECFRGLVLVDNKSIIRIINPLKIREKQSVHVICRGVRIIYWRMEKSFNYNCNILDYFWNKQSGRIFWKMKKS